jgi:hypothetical protein
VPADVALVLHNRFAGTRAKSGWQLTGAQASRRAHLGCGAQGRHHERAIEGVTVRVTSPARTVVDCFKFRNKIGVDVAVEVLQDYRRLRKGTVDELWCQANQFRM